MKSRQERNTEGARRGNREDADTNGRGLRPSYRPAALSLPLLSLAMEEMIPGQPLKDLIPPRHKPCSEYLSPGTTPILERLGGGVLDAVEHATHAKVYGMKVVAPGGAATCGRFRGAVSFALPRATFDTILLRAAERAGAVVREGTTVEDLVWRREAVAGVVARSGNGQRVTCHARIVVGADGLRSVVARRLGLVAARARRRGTEAGAGQGAGDGGSRRAAARDRPEPGRRHDGARGAAAAGVHLARAEGAPLCLPT